MLHNSTAVACGARARVCVCPCVSLCAFVCVFVCLCVCARACKSVSLSACLFVRLCLCLFACPGNIKTQSVLKRTALRWLLSRSSVPSDAKVCRHMFARSTNTRSMPAVPSCCSDGRRAMHSAAPPTHTTCTTTSGILDEGGEARRVRWMRLMNEGVSCARGSVSTVLRLGRAHRNMCP